MKDNTLSNDELAFLLQECSENNKAALEQLYKKVAPTLNRYAMGILRCEALSNEVLQDSMLQIWEKAEVFDAARGNPMSWMHAIVRNRAIDKIRTENKHLRNYSEEQRMFAEHVPALAFQPETELSQDQLMSSLNHHFASLPKDQRLSLYLTYFYDLSRSELADALDTNINTIKSWLRRGLKSLKQHEDMAKSMS
jgi:RNA polymerase sigma-70 factor (ECF subfamily)